MPAASQTRGQLRKDGGGGLVGASIDEVREPLALIVMNFGGR